MIKTREIKFRGKRSHDGKWICGGYYYDSDNDQRFIVSDTPTSQYFHLVIPETVGQFTGLKDKNGKEIYEGDIIRTIWGYAQILFEDGGFSFKGKNNDNWLRSDAIEERKIEVIGNVDENRNLIETNLKREIGL